MNGIETILDARIDELRKALDAIGDALDERRFEAPAALGYGDITSAFIFLQRTLGDRASQACDDLGHRSSGGMQLCGHRTARHRATGNFETEAGIATAENVPEPQRSVVGCDELCCAVL